MSIQTLTESDQGDYTCSVQNMHGSDQILYEIIVQVPPASPLISIKNLTHTGIEVAWSDSRSRKQPVLGYTLHYRREHTDWSSLDSDPLSKKFWLRELECGTNYSVYIRAYNHVGQGKASEVMSARTLGRVPDVPNPDELLAVNKTLVTLNLNSFGTGGCPIVYYVIQYRRDVQPQYTLVSNNVSPANKDYTIRGLDPAARYFIRVTAHNSAGYSVAEYPFATLTSNGGTIPPPVSTARETSFSYPLIVAVKVLTTVFFSACLIVAAFYVSHILCKWRLKRDHSGYHHDHHMFFGLGGLGGSSAGTASPMFDSLSMLNSGNERSNGSSINMAGFRHALR